MNEMRTFWTKRVSPLVSRSSFLNFQRQLTVTDFHHHNVFHATKHARLGYLILHTLQTATVFNMKCTRVNKCAYNCLKYKKVFKGAPKVL